MSSASSPGKAVAISSPARHSRRPTSDDAAKLSRGAISLRGVQKRPIQNNCSELAYITFRRFLLSAADRAELAQHKPNELLDGHFLAVEGHFIVGVMQLGHDIGA